MPTLHTLIHTTHTHTLTNAHTPHTHTHHTHTHTHTHTHRHKHTHTQMVARNGCDGSGSLANCTSPMSFTVNTQFQLSVCVCVLFFVAIHRSVVGNCSPLDFPCTLLHCVRSVLFCSGLV